MSWSIIQQVRAPAASFNALSTADQWIFHRGGHVVGWREDTPVLLWSVPCPGTAFCTDLLDAAGLIICPIDGGSANPSELLAITPTSGAVTWRASLDFRPKPNCAVILDNSVFIASYFGPRKPSIDEYDAQTGKQISEHKLQDRVNWMTTVNNTLLIGGRNGLYLGAPKDSQLSCSSTTEHENAVYTDKDLYFTSHPSGEESWFHVHWWNRETAEKLSTMRISTEVGEVLLPAGELGLVTTFPSMGSGLSALDLHTCEETWSILRDGPWSVCDGTPTPHGLVLALEDEDANSRLVTINPTTGETLSFTDFDGMADQVYWLDEHLVVSSALRLTAYAWQP